MIPAAATPRTPHGAPRVLFFADAGDRVGGGHVMRCLTLAQALRDRGVVCGFVATPAAAGILDVFAGEGIDRTAGAGDAAGVAEAARDWAADAVVVDHYQFDAAAEALSRPPSRPLMAIDDLRRAHDCDLILDSNLGRTAADYPGVQTLAGPDFALVRPDFVALRDETLARRAPNPPPRRILVSLGLTDIGGITARVVQAILPDLGDRALDVVIGAGAPSRATLETLAAQDARISLNIDTQAMPALTAAADLAIGAGGSSVWERCCLGLPSLTLILADNQRPNALALEAACAAVIEDAAAPDFEDRLPSALHRLSADPIARAALSQAAGRICDGRGAGRVAERLLALIAGDSPRHRGLR